MKSKSQTPESAIELQDTELDTISAGAQSNTKLRSEKSASLPIGRPKPDSQAVAQSGNPGDFDLGDDFSP